MRLRVVVSPGLLRTLNLHPDWAKTWLVVNPSETQSVGWVVKTFWGATVVKERDVPLAKVASLDGFLFLLDSPASVLRVRSAKTMKAHCA